MALLLRFRVTGPVEDGYQYWAVTDTLKNIDLATIHHSVAGAERIARAIQARATTEAIEKREKFRA